MNPSKSFFFRRFGLRSLVFWPLLLSLGLAAPVGATPRFISLYSFSALSSSTNTDGARPEAALAQGNDGNFYGTTAFGGASGSGAVVRVTPAGVQTTLYNFSPLTGGVNNDGETPQAGLVLGSDGNFYGTTIYGGISNSGTVFKVTPSGTLTTLAFFTGANGAYPYAALVQGTDGNFYGTTYQGGTAGTGTVFQVTPSGALTTLYSFSAFTGGINTDGGSPLGGLVAGSDGDFYGTTVRGGSSGDGTVFKMTPTGAFTPLVSFAGTSGANPYAALVLGRDGNFYGTTYQGGGANAGTVFQVTPLGVLTRLYAFSAPLATGTNSDGANPQAGLVQGTDGNFYGTTYNGGSMGVGTVFKITPAGVLTVLVAFTGADGTSPEGALVLGGDGNFYGTTSQGGANNSGTIFTIVTASQVLYDFSATSGAPNGINRDGANPDDGSLVQGTDGDFYGMTETGGSAGAGAVFKITPQGALTPLYDFSASTGGANGDGMSPEGGLVEGGNGNFYGTTSMGGAFAGGVVFKITPQGTLTTISSLAVLGGDEPVAGLTLGKDGCLYGAGSNGGSAGNGTVFKVTPLGVLTTLFDFGDGADGSNPHAAPIQGGDGNFYGTTQLGGDAAMNSGTVYKITPSGALTLLHTFGDGGIVSDGSEPSAGLVQGRDGNLYGTTEYGGGSGTGTVFKITPSGAFTIVHDFSSVPETSSANSDGAFPYAGLVQGTDGDFYGTTYQGGAYGGGTVFKMTPSGALTTLVAFASVLNLFSANSGGALPSAGLIQGVDGDLYGTTAYGGLNGNGVVYRLIGPTQGHDGSQITPENTPVTFTLAFDDPSGMEIDGVAFPTQAAHGTLTLVPGSVVETGTAGTATVTYTPDAGYKGVDLFTYTVTGYTGTSAPQAITVSVGPTPTWNAVAVGADAVGGGRMLWDRSDGAAGLWVLGANDTRTIVGITYGPYPGWFAKALSVASDGTSRVLWTNADGMAGIWTFSADGTATLIGTTYGPYPGWTAQSIGVASDGTSRVLWTNANGMAGVWSFDAGDAATVVGPTYGPYGGWTAKALATAPDGTSRVLWDRLDGAAGVWSFGANDVETEIGPAYGPFVGWTAQAISAAGDGTSRVLWTNMNGAAGLWSLDADDAKTMIGPINGPFAGWTALSVAASASDGTSRVLWGNVSRAAGVWSFDPSDAESVIGPSYGPY